jgi:hypothetical protein
VATDEAAQARLELDIDEQDPAVKATRGQAETLVELA